MRTVAVIIMGMRKHCVIHLSKIDPKSSGIPGKKPGGSGIQKDLPLLIFDEKA